MLISVCIPSYNRLKDLKACVASVIAAANLYNEPIEILVSDNASPDLTSEWLKAQKTNNKNVTFRFWTNEKNIGAIKNIKKLITNSNGDYLFFLTDDDLILPETFLLLKKNIFDSSPNFIKFGVVTYLTKSRKSFYYGNKSDINDYSNHSFYTRIEKYCHVLSGCTIKNDPEFLKPLINSNNVYPSIEMCAISAGSCLFISDPVVFHQWENPLFWENDVDLSSSKKKTQHLAKDAQLALLKIPDNFFNKIEQRQMCESILERYGYLEDAIQKKFKLDYMDLKIIQVKALAVRLAIKASYVLKSLYTKITSEN
jgi:glycosyltransferase involved in cell wall biosynthesis